MALYLVVHHRSAPKDPDFRWSNAWLDDDRIEAITTTVEIGSMCEAAKKRGEEVFIHRCAYGDAMIACATQIESVAAYSRTEAFVRFKNQRVLIAVPAVKPHEGQSSYAAAPPT